MALVRNSIAGGAGGEVGRTATKKGKYEGGGGSKGGHQGTSTGLPLGAVPLNKAPVAERVPPLCQFIILQLHLATSVSLPLLRMIPA